MTKGKAVKVRVLPGERKLLVTLLILGAVTGLTAFQRADAGTFERVVIWVSGLYFGANVASKWSPEQKEVTNVEKEQG